MAQPIDLDDFENDPAGLRKALRALEKRAEAAEQALADITSESRTAEIDRRFKEAGIPEKAKKLIGADTDLDAWFDEFGDVLGTKAAGGEAPAPVEKPSQEPTPEEQRAKDTLDSATTPNGAGTPAERLRAATSDEERATIMRETIAAINASTKQ